MRLQKKSLNSVSILFSPNWTKNLAVLYGLDLVQIELKKTSLLVGSFLVSFFCFSIRSKRYFFSLLTFLLLVYYSCKIGKGGVYYES